MKNIGVFDDETIEFQSCPAKDKAEIHIFTGQNGSGKTTILSCLVSIFDRSEFEEHFFQTNIRRNSLSKRLRKKTTATIGYNLTHKNNKKEYKSNAEVFDTDGSGVFSGSKISSRNKIDSELLQYGLAIDDVIEPVLNFAAFAYSGYRRIKNEKINLFDEIEENPLHQALDFVKDENSKFTINQWLGRNLSKRALALEDKNEDAKKFTKNIINLEKVIADIVGYDVRFKLKTDLSLVLIKDDQELDFDVLPDGLKSLISWVGDLLMRLDSLEWDNDTPIFDREIILFLDEIEVHLHPAWQRKVLPVVQRLFKNSQIFVSTHSPFVVNSIDDAWVYKLKLEGNGKAKVESVERSEDGKSYSYVLDETFDIKEEFGIGAEKELDEFYQIRNSILGNGSDENNIKKITKLAKDIAKQSEELNSIIQIEIRQINRKKGLNLKI